MANPTGELATSGQIKSLSDQTTQIAPTTTTTTTNATNATNSIASSPAASPTQARRPAQRKLSVFSHNGFQQLDQLDQASLKQHQSQQQDQHHHHHHQQQPNEVVGSKEVVVVGCADKARPARTDTLGSTGSSRASSCDEPTIVQQPGGMKPPLALKDSEISSSSSSSVVEKDDKKSSKSSSNSSLDSLNATTSSSSEQKKVAIPPFESIKTQLKRNSVPDAEFVRQHIDKLISHNEAVMDNCHLVNIRSYNSNNNNNNAAATAAAASLSQRRQTTTAATPPTITTTIASTSNCNNIEQQTKFQRDNSATTAKRSKRWSTTAIATNSDGTFPGQLQQIFSSASSSSSTALSAATVASQLSPSKQVQLLQTRSNGLERKRSCNLIAPSLEPIFQHQRLDLNYANNFSASQQFQQQQQQNMIEREIENLSIRHQQQAEAENLLFRQQLIQQQLQKQQQPLDLAIMKRQQEQDMLMTALVESQRQQQIHESQLLNEYLSRLMLNGQTNQNSTTGQQLMTPTTNSLNNATQVQTTSQHQHQHQLPESPAHRCDACDISFWTQELLNYHSITQCTARRGPQLSRPLAFNFVGPNNFDSLASQQQLNHASLSNSGSSTNINYNNNHNNSSNNNNNGNNLLSVPPNTSTPIAHLIHRHSHHNLTYQAQSKSASPPHRRRPHDYQDDQEQYIEERVVKGKQEAAEAVAAIAGTTTATAALSAGSTLLPFKKRKISEPNMRY